MAKKKKSPEPAKKDYRSSPFSHLKGLSVFDPPVSPAETPAPPVAEPRPAMQENFADEMALLGVERLNRPDSGENEGEADEPTLAPLDVDDPPVAVSEEEQFLQAMGQLQVDFTDSLPENESPPSASARRMKQLKQGRLSPEASLDLHGLTRMDVAEKLRFFLQDSLSQGYQTLLVITGRGLHSADGEPVLRAEAERFLAGEGHKWVAEWGRASKQYGGAGALILFLRSRLR